MFCPSLPVADYMVPFANWIKSLPPSQRPKTAAYPLVNDPFADPPVQSAQKILQAAGIKTVYSKTFPEQASAYKPRSPTRSPPVAPSWSCSAPPTCRP